MSIVTQDTIVKGLIWLIPVVFGAGAIYTTVSAQQAQTADLQKRVVEVRTNQTEHEKGEGHTVTLQRLQEIKSSQRSLSVEQRAIRTDQTRANENISAICQATNARCR